MKSPRNIYIILSGMLLVVAGCAATPKNAPNAAAMAPAAPRHLRCEYLIDPAGIDVSWPRLSWQMADDRRGAEQWSYQILVADDAAQLERGIGTLWDSGRVISNESIQVAYAGAPLRSRQIAYWKVRVWDKHDQPSPWSKTARWSMSLLSSDEWSAKWVGDPAGDEVPVTEPLPAVMLRKEFEPLADAGAIKRATAYVSALGWYELSFNGQRVSDRVLAPEWTDYRRRVQYQTYDVTELLHRLKDGRIALAAWLGDGWYAGRLGLAGIVPGGPPRAIYGRKPKLLMQLEIEYADGSRQTIVSDESWKSTNEGPIRVGDLLDGETYDARREMPDWDRPGFDDSAWNGAAVYDAGGAELIAQMNDPIRITQQLRPIAVTEPTPGAYVFDLGQNMVGWCRLKVRGQAGREITLRHAEVLNSDGAIYTDNLRSARQMDRYVCRGDREEIWEPRFTYHGFRYVEVTGLDYKPDVAVLTGLVLHSDTPPAGRFECSSPLLNQLMQNIVWTQRSNTHSVPTDCPQRDERLGWTGDILAFAQTACFNRDMAAFYRKWLLDMRDAQTPDGRYPDFAPHPYDPAARFSGVPAWGDAGVHVAWCAYRNYGDKRLLEEHFESARRWVDWIHANNPDLLWKNARGNDYGDWLNADTLQLEGWPKEGAGMPKEAFATAFFARSADILWQMAVILGKEDEALHYLTLSNDIKKAFNQAYVQPDGRMLGNTQAGYAIALNFDLLPAQLRENAVRYMIECFDRYGGNISTGFHSTICLMNELTRACRSDEAYRLINNRTMPSWGYAIDHGATTIWERWDGFVEGRGFQNPGMNSFSHYALGSVGEWMYRTIIGINLDPHVPAYKQFALRPRPGGGLTWARGSYDSMYGRIESSWRIVGDKLILDFVVPPNTSAIAYIPTADPASVREGGKPAAQASGVRFMHAVKDESLFRILSGAYQFVIPWESRESGKPGTK